MPLAQADIHVRIDPKIKSESETILNEIGISMSDLVNITLRKVIRERGIPFDTRLKSHEIPECMQIESEEELYALIDKDIEESKRSGKYYTVDEVEAMLERV